GLVELHGRDAKIEQYAVDRVMTLAVRHGFEVREPILDQHEPARRRFDERKATRDRALVAVDADHTRIGCLENGARMPAGTERTVDIDTALTRVEIFGDRAAEHGNMTGQSASDSACAIAARHYSRAFCASCAATREPSCFLS